MKLLPITALLVLAIVAGALSNKENENVASKEYLKKEFKMLRLLMNIEQPLSFKEEKQISDKWKFEENLDKFNNPKAVENFISLHRRGLTPHGTVFSIIDTAILKEVTALYHVFYYARDFDTFHSVACWARDHVNEGIFFYVFTIAILHRPDTQDLILPPPYEVYPNYFINWQTIDQAIHQKLENPNLSGNTIAIVSNYTIGINKEQVISSFSEDINFSSYNFYLNADYPFWMEDDVRGFSNDRMGELIVYAYRQVISRVNMERYSYGVKKLDDINLKYLTHLGFVSSIRDHSGMAFSDRYWEHMHINEDFLKLAAQIQLFEARVSEAVDSGLVINNFTRKVVLNDKNGYEVLGNMIKGNYGHVLGTYYGNLDLLYRKLFSFSTKHNKRVLISVLENDATAFRDPIFLRFLQKLLDYTDRLSKNFPHYTRKQLDLPSVKIESVEIDPITTYMSDFNVDITNAIPKDIGIEPDKVSTTFIAKMRRLNSKPFKYNIKVNSEKDMKVVVRSFLGFKYDDYGKAIDMNSDRLNFLELDKFIYSLKKGQNVISRSFEESHRSTEDYEPFMHLYHRVVAGMQNKSSFVIENKGLYCAVPRRLMLPRGDEYGTVFQMFFMLTSIDSITIDDTYNLRYWCRVGSGHPFFDKLPMGYPFDRPIDENEFYTPNMYFKDVIITHKENIKSQV